MVRWVTVDECDKGVLKVLASWSGVGGGDGVGRRVNQRLLGSRPPVWQHNKAFALITPY